MDPSSQFTVPTIIDVPELIVTNEDIDFDETTNYGNRHNNVWLSNKLQLLSTALSYTIGLGNIWRFPYLCYKHAGGAFLLAYTFILITVGLSLFLMELAFGQYANEGPITIWRISPAFEGIGYAMCLISSSIAIYYNLVNTWILHYLMSTFTFGSLGWSSCDNSWNTANCFLKPDEETVYSALATKSSIDASLNKTNVGRNIINDNSSNINCLQSKILDSDDKDLGNNSLLINNNCLSTSSSYNETFEFDKIINSTNEVILPTNEYFHNNLLKLTQSIGIVGGINWDHLIGMIVIWCLVFLIVLKNLKPITSRVAIIGLLMPYLALVALFIRALSLNGSMKGISYYLTVEWNRLQNIDIWADATTQIFFSLSPCWGGVISLASMNKFHNNFHSNAMIIAIINYVTAIFSGLVSFAILGYMSSYSGIAMDEVVDSGIGFIFMVYTEALARLPMANLNSAIFFALLLFLGIINQLTVIETVINTIVDTWPHKLRYRRPLVITILCTIMFILSLATCFHNGFYVIELLDTFAGTYTAIIVGIFELIAIAWVYGLENFTQDIDDMISVHRNLFPSRLYWSYLWRYLTPSIMFAILLFSFTDLQPPVYRGYQLPNWTLTLGWILTFVCILVIPIMAFIRFLLSPSGTILDKISYLCRPSEDWAPSSYISGPKLISRHQMLDDSDLLDRNSRSSNLTNSRQVHAYEDPDQDSNDSNEDLKVVNGKANYIIPEEEDDTDTGLIASETNI